MILSDSYADCISFKESGFTLNDFKVSYEFYDILKEEDPDCYMFLINPYAIMKGKEDFSSMVVDRFFLDVAEKLEQDNSSIIETVKQDFIGLV